MKYKHHKLHTLPRLLVEQSVVAPQKRVGYLQLRDSGEKIEIGSAESGEFRLVQCLFSPQNFPSAKYEPVVQTYERIFAVIQTQSLLERSAAERGSHREITHTVEKLLHNLQKGNMRHHVTFISKNNRVLMEIL